MLVISEVECEIFKDGMHSPFQDVLGSYSSGPSTGTVIIVHQ